MLALEKPYDNVSQSLFVMRRSLRFSVTMQLQNVASPNC